MRKQQAYRTTKEAGVELIISDKEEFKAKALTREKGYYVIENGVRSYFKHAHKYNEQT